MIVILVEGLQCYQCDSAEDSFCPAFGYFDETKNAMVDCYGLESATPGHMCVKISKSSPDTLYAKGWKTTIRRCASRSDFSVSWGCRYYIDEFGLYVETCYCSDKDGCNAATSLANSWRMVSVAFVAMFLAKKTRVL